MRMQLVAVFSCLTLFGSSLAQSRQSPQEEISHLVERYDNSWNSKDKAGIERILAPDYVYFTSKGGVESRQDMLNMLLSPKYTLASAERSEMKVYRVSSTAVVSSRWKGHGTDNGQEFHDDQRCSIVLGLEKQGWQVLSEHCTQIAAP
jgi:ketosteroid isomerase-like protein